MMLKSPTCLAVAATLFASLLITPWPTTCAAAADLDLAAGAARVSGLSPGGTAAVLSVWRERALGAGTRVHRIHLLAIDDDGDGLVTLDLSHPVPSGSVWIIVDLESGETTLQAPAASGLREMAVDPRRFARAMDRLVVDRSDIEVLAVRPGVGAWSLSLHDGGDIDGDRTDDGRITLALVDLEPLGETATPPPDSLEAGDVIALIDPRRMDAIAVRIAQ